ncbi:MAG: hypothetical protein DRO52_05880 [Candidatus Hecatellales archaeon]|nr:MAG: hypothetical protein DRO52_05880 [Candidatus Hecatellales archaeon]
MKCPICGREVIPGGSLCDRHTAAYRNLLEGFKTWSKAMEIGWKDYLKAIISNPAAGRWVKEVARRLVEEEG